MDVMSFAWDNVSSGDKIVKPMVMEVSPMISQVSRMDFMDL